MKIIAKFIGRDGSLGYRKHRYYYLNLNTNENKICIMKKDELENKTCEYSSFIKFLENWTNIDTQHD